MPVLLQNMRIACFDFSLPDWRTGEKDTMVKADINHLKKSLQNNNDNDCLFIAEDERKNPVGFLRMVLLNDYYTGEQHAHVNDIVVTANAEGKGVGKLLLQKADDWAKENKARWVTLNVFNENLRARQVYEKAGYKTEWIKYLKPL